MGHPDNEQPHLKIAEYDLPGGSSRPAIGALALHRLGEICEKLVSKFFGRSVDQPLAKLGELAPDLRLDVVGQERAAFIFGQCNGGAPLGEPCNAALAFAGYLVAVRWV